MSSSKIRKGIVVLTVAVVGLVLAVSTVLAQPPAGSTPPREVLYASDTLGVDDGHTALFQVDLDEVGGQANLTLLPNGVLNFNHADTLAATPDGSRLYFIDDGPGQTTQALMGYYDVATAAVHTVGVVQLDGVNLTGFDQATFSHEGILYATSTRLDRLYTIDLGTAEATELGVVVHHNTSIPIDIAGADLAFDADGVFYMFTNSNNAPKGLYTLALPPVWGQVSATYVGEPGDGFLYRGIAVRANGYGDIVATTGGNQVRVLDKETGQDAIDPLPLFLEGEPFVVAGGDMTSGPLALCTRTIGYWKNHDWDRSITILGVPVSQTEGQMVLRNATSKDFSMLFAQLIAAKLNVNNATGLPVIDDAEAWLATQTGLIHPDGSINWFKGFEYKKTKVIAGHYKDALDEFNNAYHCEDDGFEKPAGRPVLAQ